MDAVVDALAAGAGGLMTALWASLPGGTIATLLIEMLTRKASQLRVRA